MKQTYYILASVLLLAFMFILIQWVQLVYFPCVECRYLEDPQVTYLRTPWILRMPGGLVLLILSVILFMLGKKKNK